MKLRNVLSYGTLIFSLSNNAAIADDTFVFKGLLVGGVVNPRDVEQALRPEAPFIGTVKCGSGAGGMQVCIGNSSAAGVPAIVNAVISNGHLIRISLSIPSEFFDTATQGAIEKYGRPLKTTSSNLQNRMGANFENTTLFWGNELGTYLQMSKYGSTIDRGSIYFGTAEDTALLTQSRAPKKGDF